MEQERKIEKWLRTYAKKRRGQAGDSFKLDPATRRMLQNEISGSAPSSEDDDESLSLWEVLRRHWLFFLGFAMCIFILASFFFQPQKIAKSRASVSSSSQSVGTLEMRQIQTSVHHSVAKNEAPATNGPLANRGNPPPPTILLSENASAPAVAPPAPSTETATAAAETPAAAAPPAPVSSPAMIPPRPGIASSAVAPASAAELPQFAEANEGHKFTAAAKFGPAAQNSFMNTIAAPTQSATVLMNFQVVQNGNSIRVVDQDGSVYSGTLQAEEMNVNAVAQNAPATTGSGQVPSGAASHNASTQNVESPRRTESDKLAPARSPEPAGEGIPSLFNRSVTAAANPAAPANAEAVPPGIAGAAPSAAPVYTLRVGGLNRTLKQSVVFTATLIQDLGAMQNAQVTFGMGANAAYGSAFAQQMMKSGQTNQAAQLPWSRLRIAGTAIVDQTNRFQINAAPVTSANSNMPN